MRWGQLVLGMVLIGLGAATWRVGETQERAAVSLERLALLDYGASAEADDVESSSGLVGLVPGLAASLGSDTRTQSATAEYWQKQYAALEPPRDEAGTPIKQPPELMFLAANATFRNSQQTADRQGRLRLMDEAFRRYGEVLKERPDLIDASFNYEYVAREREALMKVRPGAPRAPALTVAPADVAMAGDLPDGLTLHGQPGGPPPSTDMSQFKLHVPVRPEERQGGQDQGPGNKKIRKG